MAERAGSGNRRKDESEWFAEALGERWTTAGDGIYRLVEDPVDDETSNADDATGAGRTPAPDRVARER